MEEIDSALNEFGNRWCKGESVQCDPLKERKLSIFNIVKKPIKFYLQNRNLLPPKPKTSFRYLRQGNQEFHRKNVMVPSDKAANNVVVVCMLHNIKSNRKAMNRNRSNQKANTTLKTKTGNK